MGLLDNFEKSQNTWMYACSKCGECVDECPVYQQTANPYTAPGYKIKKMRPIVSNRILPFFPGQSDAETRNLVKGLYDCTLCGRCVSVCPYKYDLVDLWEPSRESAVANGLEPDAIREMIANTQDTKNFLKRPHERRSNWRRGLKVPEPRSAETLYFVGCVISYTPTLKAAARGVSTILNAANEDWAPLGEEWCCGVPLMFGGGTERMKEFVTHNIDAIEASGAKQVVFSCPGCLRMFKQVYPRILGRPLRFSTRHIVELVDDYVRQGKLTLSGRFEGTVTYHDPCELTRLLGVVEEPRAVLEKIAHFVELPENRYNTHCCGGGGLYKAVDTENSLEIAKQRVQQAERVGSAALVSACPSCITNLWQSARRAGTSVKVMDFADIVAQQLREE
jgi:Fe-S oxidoreductase